MHGAPRDWVKANLPEHYETVLEVGSLDINGGVRDLLDPAATYTGVDMQRGPGVDIVADFTDYLHPEKVDLILCCEVLEHFREWPLILDAAQCNLRPGGRLIVTCATHGRSPHSARSESPIQPDEWYENVDPERLLGHLKLWFHDIRIDVQGTDLRAVATA